MDRHCSSALLTVQHPESPKSVNYVLYPELDSFLQKEVAASQMKRGGGLVSFEVPGGSDGAMKFLNSLEMISLSSNLGDARSIATHPSTTTHARLTEDERIAVGVTPGLIRLSVGLEEATNILKNLDRTLEKAFG